MSRRRALQLGIGPWEKAPAFDAPAAQIRSSQANRPLGERSTALRLYTRCVTMLREELGVEPLPETTALYNALREMH